MNPDLQVLLSISEDLQNEDSLKTILKIQNDTSVFRTNIIDFLNGTGKWLDGFELDFVLQEPQHRVLHLDILKAFSEILDEAFFYNNVSKYLLMTTLSRIPEQIIRAYDVHSISSYVDMVFLPAFNLTVDENAISQQLLHPSRLMGISDMANADSMVDLVISLGLKPHQLVLGVPTFGSTYKLLDGGDSLIKHDRQTVPYSDLCQHISSDNWMKERDSDQSAVRIYMNESWTAYEDVKSIQVKCQYAMLRNLAGVGLWTIDDDDYMNKCGKSQNYPLLNAAADTFAMSHAGKTVNVTRRERRASINYVTRIVDRSGDIHMIAPNAETTLKCTRQGYYRHPHDCGQFYRCVKFNQYKEDFTIFEYNCPNGLVFDERWEVCSWASVAPPCFGSQEIFPIPKSKFICNSEGYFRDPENCRWFYKCSDFYGDGLFTMFEFRCPFDLAFDEENLICNWKWLVPSCGEDHRRLSYESVPSYDAHYGPVIFKNISRVLSPPYEDSDVQLDSTFIRDQPRRLTYADVTSGGEIQQEHSSVTIGDNRGRYLPSYIPSEENDFYDPKKGHGGTLLTTMERTASHQTGFATFPSTSYRGQHHYPGTGIRQKEGVHTSTPSIPARQEHQAHLDASIKAPITPARKEHQAHLDASITTPITPARQEHQAHLDSSITTPITPARKEHQAHLDASIKTPITPARQEHQGHLDVSIKTPITPARQENQEHFDANISTPARQEHQAHFDANISTPARREHQAHLGAIIRTPSTQTRHDHLPHIDVSIKTPSTPVRKEHQAHLDASIRTPSTPTRHDHLLHIDVSIKTPSTTGHQEHQAHVGGDIKTPMTPAHFDANIKTPVQQAHQERLDASIKTPSTPVRQTWPDSNIRTPSTPTLHDHQAHLDASIRKPSTPVRQEHQAHLNAGIRTPSTPTQYDHQAHLDTSIRTPSTPTQQDHQAHLDASIIPSTTAHQEHFDASIRTPSTPASPDANIKTPSTPTRQDHQAHLDANIKIRKYPEENVGILQSTVPKFPGNTSHSSTIATIPAVVLYTQTGPIDYKEPHDADAQRRQFGTVTQSGIVIDDLKYTVDSTQKSTESKLFSSTTVAPIPFTIHVVSADKIQDKDTVGREHSFSSIMPPHGHGSSTHAPISARTSHDIIPEFPTVTRKIDTHTLFEIGAPSYESDNEGKQILSSVDKWPHGDPPHKHSSTAPSNIHSVRTTISPQPISIKTPQSIGITAPPSIGTTVPQFIGVTTPKSIGVIAPQSNGIKTPQSISITAPPSISTTVPQFIDVTVPPSIGVTTPKSIGVTAPQSNGIKTPQSIGTTAQPPVGIRTPQSNGITTPQFVHITTPQSGNIDNDNVQLKDRAHSIDSKTAHDINTDSSLLPQHKKQETHFIFHNNKQPSSVPTKTVDVEDSSIFTNVRLTHTPDSISRLENKTQTLEDLNKVRQILRSRNATTYSSMPQSSLTYVKIPHHGPCNGTITLVIDTKAINHKLQNDYVTTINLNPVDLVAKFGNRNSAVDNNGEYVVFSVSGNNINGNSPLLRATGDAQNNRQVNFKSFETNSTNTDTQLRIIQSNSGNTNEVRNVSLHATYTVDQRLPISHIFYKAHEDDSNVPVSNNGHAQYGEHIKTPNVYEQYKTISATGTQREPMKHDRETVLKNSDEVQIDIIHQSDGEHIISPIKPTHNEHNQYKTISGTANQRAPIRHDTETILKNSDSDTKTGIIQQSSSISDGKKISDDDDNIGSSIGSDKTHTTYDKHTTGTNFSEKIRTVRKETVVSNLNPSTDGTVGIIIDGSKVDDIIYGKHAKNDNVEPAESDTKKNEENNDSFESKNWKESFSSNGSSTSLTSSLSRKTKGPQTHVVVLSSVSESERHAGPIVCERAGLFRHPDDCNKFYECYWDRWIQKFTLHIFNCPVKLVYDDRINGCNWPAFGPSCDY